MDPGAEKGAITLTDCTFDNTSYAYSVDETTNGGAAHKVTITYSGENDENAPQAEVWENIVYATEPNGETIIYNANNYGGVNGAFEAALASLASTGGTIELAKGEYGDLSISPNGQSLTFVGQEGAEIESATVIGTGTETVSFENISFTGASTTHNLDSNPDALYLQNLASATVENCTFEYGGSDPVSVAIVTNTVDETKVLESTIVDYTIPGYHNPSTNPQSVSYTDNRIQNAPSGIGFIGTDTVTVTGNIFENANGIRLYPNWDSNPAPCKDATIQGNSFLSLPENSSYGKYAVKTTDGTNSGYQKELNLDNNYWGTTEPEEIQSMIITGSPENATEIKLEEWYLDGNLNRTNKTPVDEPDHQGGGHVITSLDREPGYGSPLPMAGEGSEAPSSTGFESDTNADLTVNGRYQFRITSLDGHTPVFTVNNMNFTVSLASRSGNDYFYVITCAGTPSSTAAVSVDGKYLMTATVGGSASGVDSDTTHPFTVAQGGTYQFRLTAAARPSFAAGSASFTVEYAGNSGNDWFYKVHAVGQAGDSCGFYINGEAQAVAVATIA